MAGCEDSTGSVATNNATQSNGHGPSVPSKTTVVEKSDDGDRPPCFNSTIHELLFVLTTTMAVAMTSFINGVTTVIVSFVGQDLHLTNAEITWIAASSALTSGAFLLFFGRIADLFGRKPLFVASMGLYAGFSLAAGFAPNGLFLDCFNGLIGVCSAGAVPPAVGALGASYEKPSKRKNYAFACFSAGNPLGFAFGTIFSGVAAKIFGWRSSFWLLAIIYAAFTILTIFTVPQDLDEPQRLGWATLRQFDSVGAICAIAGFAMFSASLSLPGDAPRGWRTPDVLVLLILGLILIGFFLYWESVFKDPLMPMHVWKDRDFSLLMTILVLGFIGFSSSAFWVSVYMQRVKQYSSLEVAVHLLPMAIMGIVVNIISALIMHRISNKLLMLIGSISYTVSFLLLAIQKQDSSYWAFIFPSLVLTVVGADLEFTVANMYVMSSLPRHQQSIAGGIFNTSTKLCTSVALGATTAIFNSILSKGQGLEYTLRPYAPIFWFAFATAGLSIFLVPFLTIGTQGGKERSSTESMETVPVVASNSNANVLNSTEKSLADVPGANER